MQLRQLELGPMANFVYLVADPKSKECAVVDPAWDVPSILREARQGGWRITRILLTHNHPDHTNGIGGVLAHAEVPVHVHAEDALGLGSAGKNLRKFQDGERIRLGEASIEVLHTPGHTPGSSCFLFEGRLLTGDTLFIGGCGRVDLPGSDPEKLYHSLKRIAELPDDITVFPGHNYAAACSSSLGDEKKKNLYIRASAQATAREFSQLVGP